MTLRSPTLALAALLVGAVPALAQDLGQSVAARQSQFKILGLQMGVLGGMARGNAPYDAETAQAAADNVVAISMLDQRFNWPEGSDNFALDTTRAKPEIWENLDDVLAKWAAFGEAATALQAVAGDGQEALAAAVGALGGACGDCHKAYRGPELN